MKLSHHDVPTLVGMHVRGEITLEELCEEVERRERASAELPAVYVFKLRPRRKRP